MRKALEFLILPAELTEFERTYLQRVNRIAFVFFALHLPVFAAIAYFNDTRPWLAVCLTAAVLVGPVLAQSTLKNPRNVSIVYGITAMFMGGLLVHFGQGPVQIEMHFYFFALIAMCAVFANPLVIVAAAVTVALHHLALWALLPRSVFNYAAQWWVVGVHATFVVLESIATCFIARTFFDDVIGLEKIVAARTEALDGRNQEMRLLLDNVQQGFLTIDRDGRIAQERSAVVDAWFGAPPASGTWVDYLSSISPDFGAATQLAWDDLLADVMPEEVTLGQMPSSLGVRGEHYRLEYRPIGAARPCEHYLVIVTNVTTEVARERAELERREMLALFEHVLSDRQGVHSFFEDGTNMLDSLVTRKVEDLKSVKRVIHTLKGNAACYGLSSIAALCHELEDFIADSGEVPEPPAYAAFAARWRQLTEHADKLLGIGPRVLQIDDQQYGALITAIGAGESGPTLLRRVKAWKLEPTAKRLQHFAEQAKRIAERLDKGHVQIEVEDHGVRLDHARWASFWSAFVHAVRNAVDHGIELSEERALGGKPAQGRLVLRTFEQNGRLVVEVADDGRGINWEDVASRAASIGLPTATPADLERALFVDGVSTASTVTDVSGRGVGMGALLAATENLGGRLSIRSTPNRGTTVRFSFPPPALRAADSLQPRSAAE